MTPCDGQEAAHADNPAQKDTTDDEKVGHMLFSKSGNPIFVGFAAILVTILWSPF